jgi:hypothetical protein
MEDDENFLFCKGRYYCDCGRFPIPKPPLLVERDSSYPVVDIIIGSLLG